jgi:hypothetical protein
VTEDEKSLISGLLGCKIFINLGLWVLAAVELSITAMILIRLGGDFCCASIIAGGYSFQSSLYS